MDGGTRTSMLLAALTRCTLRSRPMLAGSARSALVDTLSSVRLGRSPISSGSASSLAGRGRAMGCAQGRAWCAHTAAARHSHGCTRSRGAGCRRAAPRGAPVVLEVQRFEARQPPDRRRELRERVAAKVQLAQPRQRRDDVRVEARDLVARELEHRKRRQGRGGGRQPAQRVVLEAQHAQVLEVADLVGQRGQVVAAEETIGAGGSGGSGARAGAAGAPAGPLPAEGSGGGRTHLDSSSSRMWGLCFLTRSTNPAGSCDMPPYLWARPAGGAAARGVRAVGGAGCALAVQQQAAASRRGTARRAALLAALHRPPPCQAAPGDVPNPQPARARRGAARARGQSPVMNAPDIQLVGGPRLPQPLLQQLLRHADRHGGASRPPGARAAQAAGRRSRAAAWRLCAVLSGRDARTGSPKKLGPAPRRDGGLRGARRCGPDCSLPPRAACARRRPAQPHRAARSPPRMAMALHYRLGRAP
jgi:hypothetical protein